MQKSEKFFIFTWKELTVIVLLVLISLGFFFTLGLHYGKKLHADAPPVESSEKIEASPEAVPPKDTLEQGAKHSEPAAHDSIKSATEEGIAESGLKVDEPKAVELPKDKIGTKPSHTEVVHEEAAPKATEEAAPEHAPAEHAEEHVEHAAPAASAENHVKYAIQLGSYPSKKEAQLKIHSLVKRGLHPEVRTAVVSGQTRYRVVLPNFKSRVAADVRGKELRSKRKIENFIVIKSE